MATSAEDELAYRRLLCAAYAKTLADELARPWLPAAEIERMLLMKLEVKLFEKPYKQQRDELRNHVLAVSLGRLVNPGSYADDLVKDERRRRRIENATYAAAIEFHERWSAPDDGEHGFAYVTMQQAEREHSLRQGAALRGLAVIPAGLAVIALLYWLSVLSLQIALGCAGGVIVGVVFSVRNIDLYDHG